MITVSRERLAQGYGRIHMMQPVHRTVLRGYDVIGLRPKGNRLTRWIAKRAWRWLNKGDHLKREEATEMKVDVVDLNEGKIIHALAAAVEIAEDEYRMNRRDLRLTIGRNIWLEVMNQPEAYNPIAFEYAESRTAMGVGVIIVPYMRGWAVVPWR
jgi:hypothetical protein